jgi:hypothetical protein
MKKDAFWLELSCRLWGIGRTGTTAPNCAFPLKAKNNSTSSVLLSVLAV